LAWLKTSRDLSPSFKRWWAYVSSFTFTIQHRPGKRIVTEDALSRRPDLLDHSRPSDMLSLPDADAYGLPDPDGCAEPSSLAAPLIMPRHDRPPMTHDGVLIQDQEHDRPPILMPDAVFPEHELVTCSAEQQTPSEQPPVPADISGARPLSRGMRGWSTLRSFATLALWPTRLLRRTDAPVQCQTAQADAAAPAATGDPHLESSASRTPDHLLDDDEVTYILDHAFFGDGCVVPDFPADQTAPWEVASPLLQEFPVSLELRPQDLDFLPDVCHGYIMSIGHQPLRRSTRLATATSVPDATPRAASPTSASDADSHDTDPSVNPDGVQHDSHVVAWRTSRLVASRPKPPVGQPPPGTTVRAALPPDACTTLLPDPVHAPWLSNLGRFGPPLQGPTTVTPHRDPETPAWLERLQNEWVSPTTFLDLWRPD
jgi:hypothetical protein